MKQKRLIVNSDGFGFGSGATRGILEALATGRFITSVSVNVNFPAADQTKRLVEKHSDLSIGVHLNPLAGEPVLPKNQVPSLVNVDGEFHNQKFRTLLRAGKINRDELEAELDAQIEKGFRLAGKNLTHIDSQGNSHLDYFQVFLRLAAKHRIQMMRTNNSTICLESESPRTDRAKAYMLKPHRFLGHRYRALQMAKARRNGMKMADRLITVGYSRFGNKSVLENWKRILRNLPPGTSEIYCHPGYPDETLEKWSYYVEERKKELDIFTSGELREYADKMNIQLINFFDL